MSERLEISQVVQSKHAKPEEVQDIYDRYANYYDEVCRIYFCLFTKNAASDLPDVLLYVYLLLQLSQTIHHVVRNGQSTYEAKEDNLY